MTTTAENGAARYPIDLAALQKGDVVTQEQLEHIFGFRQAADPERYRHRQLRFRNWLMREMKALHRPVTVRCCKRELVLLTSVDASEYNDRQWHNSMKRIRRAFWRLVNTVDIRELDQEERKAHENRLVNGSRIVQALKLHKRIELTPTTRTVPGLPTPQLSPPASDADGSCTG